MSTVEEPFVSLATFLFWSTTVLLAGGLTAAFTLKEKETERLNTAIIIGDIVILLSLTIFAIYTICMYIWLFRQYVSLYRWMTPFN